MRLPTPRIKLNNKFGNSRRCKEEAHGVSRGSMPSTREASATNVPDGHTTLQVFNTISICYCNISTTTDI